ncbi:MAG TPA: PKD domain-containing protein [Bacteroidales bacterium]|nr:PKD domain-containing protein [Bacteroidales bacterium]
MTLKNVTYYLAILGFLAGTLFLSSCEKDDDEPQVDPSEVTADAGTDIQTGINEEVTLDGSGSTTSEGTLSYLWDLMSSPNGSVARIEDATSKRASFTPDKEGAYNIRLTVSVGGTSKSDNITVTASSGPIELPCSQINEEMTLDKKYEGVVYHVPCMIRVNAGLIIEPGVTVQFAQGAGFQFSDYGEREGYLKAVGTEQDSIRFTGAIKTEGAWDQLKIGSGDLRNTMKYCIVEYAGSQDGSKAAIQVDSDSKIELKNSLVRRSSGYGMFVTDKGNIKGFANNIFTQNKSYPLHIAANKVSQLDGRGTSYTGNATDDGANRDEIYVFSNSLYDRGYITGQEPHVWTDPGVPFFINELLYVGKDAEGTLRIMPGCEITFGQNFGMTVDRYNASLQVMGTADDKVTFRGRNGQGSWNGIYLNTNNLENTIQYAVITDGGQSKMGSQFDNPANLSLGYNDAITLSLDNVQINNSAGCGIVESGTVNLTTNNVTFSGNTGNDYCN